MKDEPGLNAARARLTRAYVGDAVPVEQVPPMDGSAAEAHHSSRRGRPVPASDTADQPKTEGAAPPRPSRRRRPTPSAARAASAKPKPRNKRRPASPAAQPEAKPPVTPASPAGAGTSERPSPEVGQTIGDRFWGAFMAGDAAGPRGVGDLVWWLLAIGVGVLAAVLMLYLG